MAKEWRNIPFSQEKILFSLSFELYIPLKGWQINCLEFLSRNKMQGKVTEYDFYQTTESPRNIKKASEI